jgi:signal transduction histidine kinase
MYTSSRILLVDDEPDVREILQLFLTDLGYEVETAADGTEALAAFDRRPVDLLLSDIKMPGVDGIELLCRVKEKDPETEVVLITGHGDMALAIESLKNDAADFITKPIDHDVLEFSLRRALEKQAMRRKLREHTENLERLVAEKSAQLVEAERLAAIGQTVADLAHTIKNIAGSLKGGLFVLKKGIELEDSRYLHQGWGMIGGNVERIRGLSLDLLNFGKAGQLRCRLVDPLGPAKDVVDLHRATAADRGIDLQLEAGDGLKPVLFDPEAMHRCLDNLVGNALEAFEGVGDDVPRKVTVQVRSRAGGGVEYRLADTGTGMDKATRERLFQSFFSTKGMRGTGIGMMTVKKIVDLHGGIIDVDSSPGSGTTVSVALPAKAGQEVD